MTTFGDFLVDSERPYPEVTPSTTNAIVVSTSHRYRERAHPSSNSAPCNINESDSSTWPKYQAMIPFSFRCRLWLHSMADPRGIPNDHHIRYKGTEPKDRMETKEFTDKLIGGRGTGWSRCNYGHGRGSAHIKVE